MYLGSNQPLVDNPNMSRNTAAVEVAAIGATELIVTTDPAISNNGFENHNKGGWPVKACLQVMCRPPPGDNREGFAPTVKKLPYTNPKEQQQESSLPLHTYSVVAVCINMHNSIAPWWRAKGRGGGPRLHNTPFP